MQHNFCTLFDKNYLYKGLALHSSMKKNCNEFKLWILCMDEIVFNLLSKMRLTNVELINLSEIENNELLSVKPSRNAGEYSWTCKPYLLLYLFKKHPSLKSITYLDSDLFFFDSPEKMYKELKEKSIGITPHRFPFDKKNWEETRGKYNAGLLFFKNNPAGIECLEWWKDRCLEWCFHRHEDGKLGDQKYLDHFKSLFPETHKIENPGINLGPWSLSRYSAKKIKNRIFIDKSPLILFHFHSLKIYHSINFIKFTKSRYKIKKQVKKDIYTPYHKELKKCINKVKKIDKKFNHGFSESLNFKNRIKKYFHSRIKRLTQKISTK